MRKIILIILIISLFFLSGCWDMVEINQRLFVSSIGVDLNRDKGMNKYIVTYVYPNINAIGKSPISDKKRFVVSIPSSSIFQAGKEFSTTVEFPFYYKHLKVLVIGEELAKDDKLMREIIDELNRDTKINKKLHVLVAEGRAKDVLESKATEVLIVDGTIYNILKDNKSASRFTPQTLTGMITEFDFNNVCIVPRIKNKGEKIIISGGSIFKDYKHIDWIGQKENRAISLIKDMVKAELMDIPYKDATLSYNITNVKSNKDIIIDKEIEVNLFIETEGYLQGYIMNEQMVLYDNDVLMNMEKAVEKEMKKEIENTIEQLQNKYNADVIGIGENLSKFHPKEWEELKYRWDQIFPEIKFNVKVGAKIRRTGLTK